MVSSAIERDGSMAMSEPRGRWVPNEYGGNTWGEGASTWSDPHGSATVHYLFGRPVRVENAIAADGKTIPHLETMSFFDPDVWRHADGNGGYSIGRLLICEDGATFTFDAVLDAAFKADPAADDALPIQRDLANDPEFMRRIEEDGFANAAYASFCNREWRREDGERHQISWRRSGGMVADLRRRGESYNDFYPYSNPYDRTSPEARDVEEIYARLGWTELTTAEAEADQELAATLLAEVELRPAGDTRPIERHRPRGVDEGDDLFSRAYRAHETGRATDAEFAFIEKRIIHEDRSLTPEQVAALLSPKP
jgi:hypothetical protein